MSYIERLRPIIEEAGHMALELRAEGLKIATKEDGSPVSNADEAVSEFLERELMAAYPHTRVVSEENNDLSGLGHALTWIIDPIDGTKKYVAGRDVWSVMVALVDTEPVCSMVYFPEANVCYWAERGQGAFVDIDGEVTRLTCPLPHEPLRLAHAPNYPCTIGVVGSHGFMKHARKLLWGRIDGYVRGPISYWDLIPPLCILQEAGAVCTDDEGNKLVFTREDCKQPTALIAHPSAHARVLAAVREHR